MKKHFFPFLCLLIAANAYTQGVAINTDNSTADPSAALEVKSTTAGVLIPRMTTAQRTAIASPATGLLVFDHTTSSFWFFSGSAWNELITTASAETDPQVASVTTGYVPRWNGTALSDGTVFDNGTNVGIGINPPTQKLHVAGTTQIDGGRLRFINTGNSVLIGENAGANDDYTNNRNIAVGRNALNANVTGVGNVAVGDNTLAANTVNSNTAVGYQSLGYNTTGTWNTGIGQNTLLGNISGSYNIAAGGQSMINNLTGSYNVGVGQDALFTKTSGSYNVAVGCFSGNNNVNGGYNVFLGNEAGYYETGSHKLYIDNSNTSTPLIYGDFSTNQLTINGNLTATGGMQQKVTACTTSSNTFALSNSDYALIFSGSTTGNSITLPTATSSLAGSVYLVINHSTASVAISSYVADHTTTATTIAPGTKVQLMCDGTNWHKIN